MGKGDKGNVNVDIEENNINNEPQEEEINTNVQNNQNEENIDNENSLDPNYIDTYENIPKTVEELVNNKDLLEKIAIRNFEIMKEAQNMLGSSNPDPTVHTKYDFIDATQNEDNIRKFVAAQKIAQKEAECRKLYDKYSKMGIIPNSHALAFSRTLFFHLDLSGTDEANEKNIKFLYTISTKEGAQQEFERTMNKIINFDFSKLNFQSEEEKIQFVDENFELLEDAFCLTSMIGDGKYQLDKDVLDFLSQNNTILENIKQPLDDLKKYSSILSITMPSDYKPPELATGFVGLVKEASKLRDKGVPGFVDHFENGKFKDALTENYLNQMIMGDIKEAKDFSTGFNSLISEGILKKDFLINYKAVNPSTHEPMTLKEGISLYGATLNELDEMIENEEDVNADMFIEDRGINKIFIEKTPEERNIPLEEKLKSGRISIEDKFIIDDYKNMISLHEQQVQQGRSFRRSFRRNELAQEQIANLYDEGKSLQGTKLSKELINAYACGIYKDLKTKHDSRSTWWHITHFVQFRKEKEAVDNCLNMIRANSGFYVEGADNAEQRFIDNVNSSSKLINTLDAQVTKDNVYKDHQDTQYTKFFYKNGVEMSFDQKCKEMQDYFANKSYYIDEKTNTIVRNDKVNKIDENFYGLSIKENNDNKFEIVEKISEQEFNKHKEKLESEQNKLSNQLAKDTGTKLTIKEDKKSGFMVVNNVNEKQIDNKKINDLSND